MSADKDALIATEYAEGVEVKDIAARYAVTEAYVERVVEVATTARPARRLGLGSVGNRVLIAVAAAWLTWFALGSIVVGLVVGSVAFAVVSVVSRGRS